MSERAWILPPSGKQLDLRDPDPWAWNDDDLAIGLSHLYWHTAITMRSPRLANGVALPRTTSPSTRGSTLSGQSSYFGAIPRRSWSSR